jgi:ABC-type dipeptide/oligopeptide/nickel transport system permease subunit
MTALRKAAGWYLVTVFLLGLAASLVAPHDYAAQFRDHTGEPPSTRFLLGTDDLGRDRFSRLLFATRVSLLTAPATAAATIALVAGLGLVSGWRAGWLDSGIMVVSDLFLSLPLLFLVLTLRALLPLNVGPGASIAALAIVLATAGWPTGTRVIRAVVIGLRTSPAVVHARAYGCGKARLFGIHVLPRLRSPLAAQFWILVPAFLIAEANLGVLGLGVSEPLPSLGNLIAELRDYQRIPEAPWILVPAGLLVSILTALHFLLSGGE